MRTSFSLNESELKEVIRTIAAQIPNINSNVREHLINGDINFYATLKEDNSIETITVELQISKKC